MNVPTTSPAGFAAAGLSDEILEILANVGLTTPTPIQEQAIPIAMTGSDLIGVAQTGTGKTLAFSLPLLEKLILNNGKALILAPTRELALQIDDVIYDVSSKLRQPVTTVVLIGGASMYGQVAQLRRRPRILIATPGRLQDHMEQRNVTLADVNTLILDEADRMLDMGFIAQIRRIVQSIPTTRQTMLFSATMSPEVTKLAAAYMKDPIRVEVARSGTAAEHVEQQLCYVGQDRKPELLHTLLNKYEGSVLVFSRTKHGAAKLSRQLANAGYQATEIHSNRSLGQRRQALDGFKSGRYRVLVATDVASRGIDVNDIALVVNYDLPDAPADYVHRIGRTGRAGKSGLAISLASHDQYSDVRTIERLMNLSLPLSEFSETRMQNPISSRPSGPSAARQSQPQRFRGNDRSRAQSSGNNNGPSRFNGNGDWQRYR